MEDDKNMSNVSTHARFGVNLDELRAAGIEVELHHTDDTLASVHLDDPKYGEALLGDLTQEERALYIEMYKCNIELEGLAREYMGAHITRIGNAIRSSDKYKPLHEAVREEDCKMDFGDDENRDAFFRLQAKERVLRSNLYWSIGERHNAHRFSIGVRSKFRAYKVALKDQ